MAIEPHSTERYSPEPTPFNQSGHTVFNKSSGSRQTPAQTQRDAPFSRHSNTAAQPTMQNHSQEPSFSRETLEAWLGPRKPSGVKFQNQGSSNVTIAGFQQPIPGQNPKQHCPNPNLYSRTSIPVFQSGMKRKSNSPPNSGIIRKPVDDYFCKVCQASCSSAITLSQHMEGRRHKANLTWTHEKCKRAKGHLPCDVCQIWCTDKFLLEMHLKGKKHNAKLQELEILQSRGVEHVKMMLRCELCLVPCMNEEAFNMHVNGKAHKARAELTRRRRVG